jgi:molybdopterin molybdotransferase
MPFGKDYNRRRSDRLSVLPIVVNSDGSVEPVDYHGSAHIHSLTFARGFAFIPLGQTTVRKGEMIDVRFL